jgi:hypothetical protein
MRRFFICAAMLALFSVSAFAKANSEKVTLPALTVGSTQLAAGDYDVTWDGTGADAKVSFLKGRKVVCTAPAKVIEQGNKNEGVETASQGGVKMLQRLKFAHVVLVFETSAP